MEYKISCISLLNTRPSDSNTDYRRFAKLWTLAAILFPMCMTFYIGTQQELPTIEFDKSKPSFHTTLLREDEKAIYNHISLPNILYFGSDQGCGCGFRHALLDDGKWLRVEDEEQLLSEKESKQKNHQELYRLIKGNLSDNAAIQIYGCWDGDFNETARSVEEISVNSLLDNDFYFKERGFYTIKNGG